MKPYALREQDPRCKTGVIGISLARETRRGRKSYRFFTVRGPGFCKQFNIDTLGREEAWRRALRVRAAFEIRRRAAVATALCAVRSGGTTP